MSTTRQNTIQGMITAVRSATVVGGSMSQRYIVRDAMDADGCTCNCKDFRMRRAWQRGDARLCKHIAAARRTIRIMEDLI